MNRSPTVLFAWLACSCLCSCVDGADRGAEVERVRTHLEQVERELWTDSELELAPEQWKARVEVLANLRAYIAAEEYPINDVQPRQTPIFIDRFGNRCAMAALIEASGHTDLAARIAREHNLAAIPELSDDRELLEWLRAFGLTIEEAARIQPSYTPPPENLTWRWTAGVLGSVLAGNTSAASFGIRVGRHGVATNLGGACDRCVYRSMAVMLEGLRTSLRDAGATNQIAALVQYTLVGDRHFELYILGGPQISLDENDVPGSAYGGKLALGYSANLLPRTWLFAELSTSARNRPRGARAQGGLELGLRW